MRLLKDVPEVEKRLLDGRMNVTTLSQVQSFLAQEKRQKNEFTRDEKLELLGQVEGMSTRETERMLATISPHSALPDRERFITGNDVEVRFTASVELLEKLNRLKGLLAHDRSTQNYAGLFEALADLSLRQLDPVEKFKRRIKRQLKKDAPRAKSVSTAIATGNLGQTGSSEQEVVVKAPSPSAPKRRRIMSRVVPQKVRDEVWERDGGRCTFVSCKTGRRCNSMHGLEIDHIQPFARGGTSSAKNLRLLCRQHNQLAAIQVFGKDKMDFYLSPTPPEKSKSA